jgi:hypothetical protein
LGVFLAGAASAQVVVDKTVAALSDGVRTELITYSDLMWQLALQPNTPLAPPRSEDLNSALQTLINQRLFALEAERLPRLAPTQAEIQAKITETLRYFPSAAAFEERLRQVGFTSVKDDNFEKIIAQRVAIDNYIKFRFESFVVVTPDEEARYYRDQYLPEFRRRNPGRAVPELEERRREINETLISERVATRIETFLDEAKRRVEVEVLIEV